MSEIDYDSIKKPLQIKIENLREGKNNIRLFRGEQIEDAIISFPMAQLHWDEFERVKDGRPAEVTPLSVINDFIKSGIYTLIDIRVEVGIQVYAENIVPIRLMKDGYRDDVGKWVESENELPVVFLCQWEPLTGAGDSRPIYLQGELQDLFSDPLNVSLNVGTQLGIQFIGKGSIMLFLNVVKTAELRLINH